jgi:uncharacterized protein (DUF58 family)
MTVTVAELLRDTRLLELTARKNVSALLSGAYSTSIVGRGLDFHEARRYQAGDPIRHIDWKMTARLAVPWVRTYLEERQREIFIAVDVSPSMRTGWQRRTKLETAVEVAATLAVSAVDAGDRLGLLTFSDRLHELHRPLPGRRQLYTVLRTLVHTLGQAPQPCEVSDPRAAIHAIESFRGRRFVLFLLSDFIDHDIPDDLRYLRARHDVSLLHIYDPLEFADSASVRLPAYSPEGGPRHTSVRPGETGSLATTGALLEEQAGRLRMTLTSCSTTAAIGRHLAGFLHRKGRRCRR